MNQENFLEEVKDVPRAINEYVRCRMILAYYFGDLELAESMSQRMPSAKEGSVAMLPIHFFLQGLITLALAKKTKKSKYRRRARYYTSQIQSWVKKGNPNCHHMVLLLQAETMGIKDRRNAAARIRRAYDDAIASAARAGFLHHQALANECVQAYILCPSGTEVGHAGILSVPEHYILSTELWPKQSIWMSCETILNLTLNKPLPTGQGRRYLLGRVSGNEMRCLEAANGASSWTHG